MVMNSPPAAPHVHHYSYPLDHDMLINIYKMQFISLQAGEDGRYLRERWVLVRQSTLMGAENHKLYSAMDQITLYMGNALNITNPTISGKHFGWKCFRPLYLEFVYALGHIINNTAEYMREGLKKGPKFYNMALNPKEFST